MKPKHSPHPLWLLLCLLSLPALASATLIDGIEYDLDDTTQTASVISKSPKYTGAVNIPSKVIFGDKTYSVTEIGNYGFSYCWDLTSVVIPENVTSIGYGAFQGCSSLTSVVIPETVTTISDNAFHDCYHLTRAEFASIESLCRIKFGFDYNSEDIDISTNFYSNPLNYAHNLWIDGNEIKDLVIPESVTSISDGAFQGGWDLTSVFIPESVTSIGAHAFYECTNLISVVILGSDTSIFSGAFTHCNSLIKAEFASIESLCSIKFRGDFSNPLYYAHNLWIDGKEATDIVIPDSVTAIGNYTFSGCSTLTSVVIPESVTTIGVSAFSGCSALTSIVIPAYVTSIGGWAFSRCSSLTSIMCNATTPPTVSDYSFSGVSFNNCKLIVPEESIDLYRVDPVWSRFVLGVPVVVEFVEIDGIKYHLNNKDNTATVVSKSYKYTINIPSTIIYSGTSYSVTSIGDSAFSGCSDLTSVVIPESVSSICNYAFSGCSYLTSITCNSVIPPTAEIETFQWELFEKCTLTVPEESLEKYQNAPVWRNFYYPLTNVTLDGITYLLYPDSQTAFVTTNSSEYTGAITIPSSITYSGTTYSVSYIYSAAFKDCAGLISVVIPESVTSIGDRAFYGCSSLRSVDIPESVTSIGGFTFYDCTGLISVTVPESVTSIGRCAFSDCSGLTSVVILGPVKTINEFTFSDCTSLVSVVIPASVTNIDSFAFSYCSTLTSIECKALKPPYVEARQLEYAFEGVNIRNCKLIVPEESIDLYKNASVWKYFQLDVSVGIDEVVADHSTTPVTIIDLSGRVILQDATPETVNDLAPGIYIVHQGNTTRKISVN